MLGAPRISWPALGLPKADMELAASVAIAAGIAQYPQEGMGFSLVFSLVCLWLFLESVEDALPLGGWRASPERVLLIYFIFLASLLVFLLGVDMKVVPLVRIPAVSLACGPVLLQDWGPWARTGFGSAPTLSRVLESPGAELCPFPGSPRQVGLL